MPTNKFPHVNTPDTRPQWMKDMDQQNLEMLLDALETPPPPSRDLPEAEQGPHNIPRFIALGLEAEILKYH